MIELMQTLLPLPVAPAISRCGIFARSADDRLAGDALAERQRQLGLRVARFGTARLSITLRSVTSDVVVVRHLDADDRLARHRRLDAQRRRRERQREVVRERGDLVDAHPRAGDHLGARLGRPSLVEHRLAAARPRAHLCASSISQPGSTPNWVTVGPSLISTTRASTPKDAERVDDQLRARSRCRRAHLDVGRLGEAVERRQLPAAARRPAHRQGASADPRARLSVRVTSVLLLSGFRRRLLLLPPPPR